MLALHLFFNTLTCIFLCTMDKGKNAVKKEVQVFEYFFYPSRFFSREATNFQVNFGIFGNRLTAKDHPKKFFDLAIWSLDLDTFFWYFLARAVKLFQLFKGSFLFFCEKSRVAYSQLKTLVRKFILTITQKVYFN